MASSRTVPLIGAVALLMENIDASDPVHLKRVLTSYLLALAVFIPASGWVVDRFGARVVFRWAILVFALVTVFSLASALVSLRLDRGAGAGLVRH